jgi:hypothetical protein
VLCLAIVHRLRPQWVAVTISAAADAEQLRAERVSRLCSRALPAFESTLATLSRIGRPQRAAVEHGALRIVHELAIVRALLTVATSILDRVSLRSRPMRALLLGAWLRLSAEHPSLTQQQFCHTLALSPRTLRSWLARPPAPADTEAVLSPLRPPRPRHANARRGAAASPST